MLETPTKQGRIRWVDMVRIVAVYTVVVIHVCIRIMIKWGEIPAGWWHTANIYNAASRVSVPLFFMVSGYLLLSHRDSLPGFFRKRMFKVALPFIAWSLIYLVWDWRMHHTVYTPALVLNSLIKNGTSFHLWFLYTLIGLYFTVPILRVLVASGNKSIMWYFIGLWVVIQPVFEIIKMFWNIKVGIQIPMVTGYVGYFVLGYLLAQLPITRRGGLIAVLVYLLASIVCAVGTASLTASTGKFNEFFYDYLSLNVIIASAAAFYLFRFLAAELPYLNPHVTNWIRRLASASFGIYLVHIIVLEYISASIPAFHLNGLMGHPVWSIPLVSLIGFLLSFAIISLLKKIPLVCHIVP